MQPRERVLVVDDDAALRAAVRSGLEGEGFEVLAVGSGQAALEAVESAEPEAVLLDVSMPGMSGLEVIQRLRAAGHEMPICVLSARDEVDDRVAGLAAGADDYVVKPFSIGEVAARVAALVRLRRAAGSRQLSVGDVTVDPAARRVRRAGRDLELTGREFDLLECLARNADLVLTREQLLAAVWGYTWDVDSNVVDVFVGYLRRKLEAAGERRVLDTVRGVGFVLRR